MTKAMRCWGKIYFLVGGILIIVNWFLLWSRFYWIGFRGTTQTIFQILNFPLSNAYFWIEAKTNPWWKGNFGTTFNTFLNDEFGPLLALVIVGLLQAAIFILLFSGFRKLWRAIKGPSKPLISVRA
jgi:hypothetical protein